MKVVAVVLALGCFAVAVLYWNGSLQLFTSHPGPHHSHGALFAALGVLALIWLRFLGPKTTTPSLR